MGKIEAEIKKLHQVLDQPLLIPDYQRPYRWQEENVLLLVQDIYGSWKENKTAYRVGSIILYKPDNNSDKDFDIVDGQQRITTLLLILKCLLDPTGSILRSKLTYNHVDSKNAIKHNYLYIQAWISQNISNEQKEFAKYLIECCELVVIKVSDLSEAFQMFDSQNGRGKELEPYNLLKAYHIRAMEEEPQEIKIICDRRWEDATRYSKDAENKTVDVLGQLFNEQIYRTRIWCTKEPAFKFSKKEISEFKGFTLSENTKTYFPFQNRDLLNHMAQNYLESYGGEASRISKRFNNIQLDNIDPFVLINQNIINGKMFFDYIETYVEIYKQLFLPRHNAVILTKFQDFYNANCNYYGSHRDGDKYLRELYKSLIFIVFDKYGEDGLDKYYKMLYALVYRIRLEKLQVKYNFVAQDLNVKKWFYKIEKSKSLLDFQELERESRKDIACKKKVEKIEQFFCEEWKIIVTDSILNSIKLN